MNKSLAVIGCGMGTPGQLTGEANVALHRAGCIIGSSRLIQALVEESFSASDIIPEKEIHYAITASQVQQYIDSTDQEYIAVLVSGDTGFFSAASGYRDLSGVNITFYPGISSVQAFCARVGISWEQICLLSLHGRNCNLVQEVSMHEWVFCLTGKNLPEIGRKLQDYDMGNLEILAGENLSLPEERIFHGIASDLITESFGAMTVLLIHNPDYWKRIPLGIPDEMFIRGKVPMTKQDIRSILISRLEPDRDSIVWDVGAGTGSVSVELALHCPQGKVYSVECNADAIELLQANRKKFRVDAMEIVSGMAPDVLQNLPAPDVVFLGGTKGESRKIVELALAKNPMVRVAATAVSLESVAELSDLFMQTFENARITQIQCADAVQKGSYHLMEGRNPVYVFCGGGKPWQEF